MDIDTLKKMRSRRIMNPTNISKDILIGAIEHVRYASSAKNNQILRYALFSEKDKLDVLFKATNLPIGHGIKDENAPSAYISICYEAVNNNTWLVGIDIGIAAQIIREYLFDQGLDSVCIYSFNRNVVEGLINNKKYKPELLISIGKSDENVNIVSSDEEVGNFKDENNDQCVRKLTSKSLIIE